MKISGLLPVVLFGISIAAYGGESPNTKHSAYITVAANGTPKVAPLRPYPRLLPFELVAPPTAQAGVALTGVTVSLNNPGDAAPDARLRLIIHEQVHGHGAGHQAVTPDNVKVEVLQGGVWVPVSLGMADESVMGAIGAEGVSAHRERYGRGGFAIPAGLNKTWQLRITFNLPGTYSLVAAVSPDNGSRHLATPAHAIIEVQ